MYLFLARMYALYTHNTSSDITTRHCYLDEGWSMYRQKTHDTYPTSISLHLQEAPFSMCGGYWLVWARYHVFDVIMLMTGAFTCIDHCLEEEKNTILNRKEEIQDSRMPRHISILRWFVLLISVFYSAKQCFENEDKCNFQFISIQVI